MTAGDMIYVNYVSLKDIKLFLFKLRSLNTDFICWRGLITKILCTPYENREGWKIAITLYNHTYYMCEFDTDARKEQRKSESHYQKVLTYGGYKFEQYVTSTSKHSLYLVFHEVKFPSFHICIYICFLIYIKYTYKISTNYISLNQVTLLSSPNYTKWGDNYNQSGADELSK